MLEPTNLRSQEVKEQWRSRSVYKHSVVVQPCAVILLILQDPLVAILDSGLVPRDQVLWATMLGSLTVTFQLPLVSVRADFLLASANRRDKLVFADERVHYQLTSGNRMFDFLLVLVIG